MGSPGGGAIGAMVLEGIEVVGLIEIWVTGVVGSAWISSPETDASFCAKAED